MGRYRLAIDMENSFTDVTLYDPVTRAVGGLEVAPTPPSGSRVPARPGGRR